MLPTIDIDPNSFLKNHCTLPALPEVVTQLQNKIYNSDVDIDEIASLISGDPSLVAQIFKVVNSAYYGLPREVVKIRIAIALIGLNEIFRMVLSLSVINALSINNQDELHRFWLHSFYVAVCTKYLAKKFDPHISFDELWPASILHDIGKLVYLKFFPDHYYAMNQYRNEQGCLFQEAENHFQFPPSSLLGTLLSEYWRLPGKVRQACKSHSLVDLGAPDGEEGSDNFNRFIIIGNLLTLLSTEELSNQKKHEIATSVRRELHSTEEDFLTIMGDIYELRSDVEQFINTIR